MPSQFVTQTDPPEALAAAEQWLAVGDVARARIGAQDAHHAARTRDDRRAQAQALSFLAHCDRLESRLRRANETSRAAARIFEQLGDNDGEARALMTLAQVSMLLGRNEEAVEAALLSVKLAEAPVPQPLAVLALNSLGLAYSWSGDHERAYAALQNAVDTARRCVPPISIYQPRLNQVWVEASRLVDERFETGTMQRLNAVVELMDDCLVLEQTGQVYLPMPGMEAMRRTISAASHSLTLTWQGKLDQSRSALRAATSSLSPTLTWLNAFVQWCSAELAWAEGDLGAATRALAETRDMAIAVGHEQLACRAHLLSMQVYEEQGLPGAALREYRALRSRERRVVADGLGAREALVEWRLEARQSERHLQHARSEARRFEKWSLEDALTGIANRRHFEQTLAAAIQSTASEVQALALAMVDVDHFKSVNDRFGHGLGDRVLKTIAGLISAQVRENDLTARLAGDEFVVLFREATPSMAADICARIQTAVVAFDWSLIAPGLRMSVTIGLGQIAPGETAEDLMHRCDQAMYGGKRRAGSEPALSWPD